MADNMEQLAESIDRCMRQLKAEAEEGIQENWMLPPPPKPGEIIHCRICGKQMLPENFSKDPITRKREFKWQQCDACMQAMFDQCDRSTPGLLSERKNGINAGRQLGKPLQH